MSSGVVDDETAQQISDIIGVLIVEEKVFLRLRQAYILAKVMSGMQLQDNLHEKMLNKFKGWISDIDLRNKLELRDAIFVNPDNKVAYMSKMRCDDEYMYNADVERKVTVIEQDINDYVAHVKNAMMDFLPLGGGGV